MASASISRTERLRSMEALWRRYLSDPSQWLDDRKRKINANSPDFRHKSSGEPLWIDGWYNPPWLYEEMRRIGIEAMETKNEGNINVGSREQEEKAKAFVAVLKSCAHHKDFHKGSAIHADILKTKLLENNQFVGNALITMYAKCGAFAKAEEVLKRLPIRNVVSWSALIAGYAQQGHGQEALNCYKRMQDEGLSMNTVTCFSLLKACGTIGALDEGELIHDIILKQRFLEGRTDLGGALVDMYARCGALAKAKEVLEGLAARDVGAWSSLIVGYAQQGSEDAAVHCLEQMQHDGLCPDVVAFASVLKACGSVEKGGYVHVEIVKQGLLVGESTILGGALVAMYAKCGALAEASQVLGKLPARDVVSWSALVAGYVQHEQGEEALNCFEKMQHEDVSPNAITFACALKACGSLGELHKGKQIHGEIARQGLFGTDLELGGALVDMYAKCGVISMAHEVLESLRFRNVVTWSALIAGYAQKGHGVEALDCFEKMQGEGYSPDVVTFASILKAFGSVEQGEYIHSEIIKRGLVGRNTILSGALVAMYAKCGALAEAAQVLSKLPVRDVVSWSALVAGYAQHEQGREALNCFEEMQREGVSPNAVTFACALKACGSLGELNRGKQIHGEISRQGLFGTDLVIGGALVDMYAKCGALTIAHEVLESLHVRSVVTWSALIAGYSQKGRGAEALEYFEQMQHDGFPPDVFTFACVLKACGNIGATEKGEKLHAEAKCMGLLGHDIAVGNALVDMYAKCGSLTKAQEVLNELPARNVVSWTSLVAGYAQQGQAEEAFNCLKQMECDGVTPNEITFSCVLNACSHAGLVKTGQMYFTQMSRDYGIIPDSEHHSCMVDLFSRAGHLDEAVSVIKKMPHSNSLPLWSALLGACRKWGNVNLGRFAFDHAVQLDKKDALAYVCMIDLYLDAGMREEAKKIKTLRLEIELGKSCTRWNDKCEYKFSCIDGETTPDFI